MDGWSSDEGGLNCCVVGEYNDRPCGREELCGGGVKVDCM